jgi:hypothetical protein
MIFLNGIYGLWTTDVQELGRCWVPSASWVFCAWYHSRSTSPLSYPRTGSGSTTRPGQHPRGTRLPLHPPESCCPIHLGTSPHLKPLLEAHHHRVVMVN